jgi:hypothetical protein
MITAHIERLSDTMEELKPFFGPHWDELALDKDKVPLDPQYEEYLRRENLGGVLLSVLREAGQVVAYFVGFTAPGLHYQTCLTLTMDIFWVHPDYRDGDSLEALEADMLAVQLFDSVVEEAKRRGVQRVFFGSKWHKDAGEFFERYEKVKLVKSDVYYCAWLGE